MTSAQADLSYFLEAKNIGVTGTNIFWDYEPDIDPKEPNLPILTLYGYAGAPGEYEHDQRGPFIDKPRVQVIARSRDYEAAEDMAEQAYHVIDRSNITLGTVFYTMIRALQTPSIMGLDANARHLIGFNVETRRRN